MASKREKPATKTRSDVKAKPDGNGRDSQHALISELTTRLEEAEETLQAIRSGEVDAVIVAGDGGEHVYTLTGADQVYRVTLETMSEGVITLAKDGTILFSNRRFADMLSLPLDQVLGSSIYRFVAPHEQDGFAAVLGESFQKTVRAELELIRANGSFLPILLSTSPLHSDGVRTVTAIVTDLTNRRRAERELQKANQNLEQRVAERTSALREANWLLQQEVQIREEAEARLARHSNQLSTLLANISSGVALVDETGRFTICNPKFMRMFGLPDDPESILNVNDQNWGDWQVFAEDGTLLHVDDHPVRKATMTGQPVMDILVGVGLPSGGDLIWMLISATPLMKPDGTLDQLICTYRDITERRRMEEAVRESEERLRVTLESIGDGFLACDEEWRFVYLNAPAERILGIHRDDVLGKCHWDVFPQTTGTKLEEEYRRAAAGEIRDFENFYEPWGLWFHNRCFPRKGGGMSVYFKDITDRKKAEESIRQSEQRERERANQLEAIMDAVPGGIFLASDPECRVMTGNRGAYELLKSPVGSNVSQSAFRPETHWREFKDGNLLAPEELPMQRAARGEEVRGFEMSIVFDDGEIKTVHCNASPVRGADGAITGGVAVLTDITERKKAEEALRESEERFRTMADGTPLVIWVTDAAGRIEFTNQAYREFFGVSLEEVQTGGWQPLVHPDDAPSYVSAYMECLKNQKSFHAETRVRRRDGEWRWIDSYGEPRFSASGEFLGVGGNSLDITERKVFEDEIRLHSDKLEQMVLERTAEIQELERQRSESEKDIALGRMAAQVAHEINNPLAGIKNSFRLIKPAIPPDHKYYNYVSRIEKELDRTARIVRLMFDLNRPKTEAADEVELSNVIGDVIAALEPNAHSHEIALECDTSKVTKRHRVHEDSLRQVLFNIVQNGIEASSPGGTVRIAVTETDGKFAIDVTDHGQGVPPELRSRIFEPFVTTKTGLASGGLGLGLSITHGIVDSMGGTLTFESTPGQGSTFTVTFPQR